MIKYSRLSQYAKNSTSHTLGIRGLRSEMKCVREQEISHLRFQNQAICHKIKLRAPDSPTSFNIPA